MVEFDQETWLKLSDYHRKADTPDSLLMIRRYLDSVGYVMTKPRYYYHEKNIATWKFLHGKVKIDKTTGDITYINRYNDKFQYSHLL